MRRKRTSHAVCWAFMLSLAWASLATAQIEGEWEVKMMFGERTTYHALVVKKTEDGTLDATWNGSPLGKVTFENNKLTFGHSTGLECALPTL